MQWPFWNATSADQSTCKETIQPFHSDVSCMRSCIVLLEPLLFLMYATTGTECPPELVENHDVMLFIDRHCLCNIILKPKQSNYAMFRYGNPCSALYRVQWSLKDFIWRLRSPEHRVFAVDIERSGLHHWTTHSEENLDFLQSCFRTTGISQHVLPCHFDLDSVWVQLKVILQDSVNRWMRKTQLLRASPEWLFWTLPNRISHCVDILWGSCSQLSTTCWFLSSFGGLYQCSCVLELLYPASNLELMGKVIEIKPSAVSRLDSLQWFRLQIEGHTKCFFLYWPCHLLDQMKCYSIFYQPWKTQNNTINISGVINLQMGHVYNKTPCRKFTQVGFKPTTSC